jgi:hypothetical protein
MSVKDVGRFHGRVALLRRSFGGHFFPLRKEKWWTLRDSNPGPLVCDTNALTN